MSNRRYRIAGGIFLLRASGITAVRGADGPGLQELTGVITIRESSQIDGCQRGRSDTGILTFGQRDDFMAKAVGSYRIVGIRSIFFIGINNVLRQLFQLVRLELSDGGIAEQVVLFEGCADLPVTIVII